MTPQPARPAKQRKQDTLNRLEHDEDLWVATAEVDGGVPYLVPLSYLWDGSTLLLATPANSPTGRNLRTTGRARLGIGPTRDVVMIEGTVDTIAPAQLPEEVADRFAARTGFDPRQLSTPYLYFRVRPQRVQAWREANELAGRELMRDGEWLVAD
ncbi:MULTISPECIES: pyridoxamine 5'-phosphate oxidase family protein [unclassified Streptomyces]|uniref:pyridoxamine 5'-phosphate oxidase family protein n=1 Tax=unclassified Streptomyces TaxID=2593676 RepID=UPI0023656E58|nr:MULTISPECIES: pyridoxamine 5'-phosphate oxidase family protein [unclassified Streptomyces]MDF3143933.1 pyridoxamine 5'-phosphate oxidase family protein [Streptomyces sp. T21Q-yed]WDF35597.1 pyridoxamine 5'-phosphate oxidase family protein [Streptomyces sp. T12]